MILTVQNNRLTLPDGTSYPCVLGKAGIAHKTAEGDHITPIGIWPMRQIYYRNDKIEKPDTSLPVSVIEKDDIWIDEPDHPHYNTLSKAPSAASHEKMWRDDDVYDLVVTLGYNDDPVVAGKGSAIFMHVARPDMTPTEGCVALTLKDLQHIVAFCGTGSVIDIKSDRK